MSTAPAWAAGEYDALPLPHVAWGAGVIQRLGDLTSAAGESGPRVVDAGCGTGRDAAALLAGHPRARLVGLDADRAMLARARERLVPYGGRASLMAADLGVALEAPVLGAAAGSDAVMSVAAFHWVPDTAVLAANLAALLRPGGRLAMECGGAGQLAAVDHALTTLGQRPLDHVAFRTDGDWGEALAAVGFDVQRVALRPDPLTVQDLEVLARYLATIILRLHVADLPEADRLPFAREVAERLPGRTVDYVRLEAEATRR